MANKNEYLILFMITQFSCSSSPTFIVTKDLAPIIFKTIGKEAQSEGIILNCEFDTSLHSLKKKAKLAIQISNDIPLSTRLYPLIQMIEAAKSSNDKFILWKPLR
ncbi:MAG: DUF1840 family protein [Burkholderiaceae bacterium]|nr:MAG: DUF1840 family protein [Burkholderiaceae bacterium]